MSVLYVSASEENTLVSSCTVKIFVNAREKVRTTDVNGIPFSISDARAKEANLLGGEHKWDRPFGIHLFSHLLGDPPTNFCGGALPHHWLAR